MVDEEEKLGWCAKFNQNLFHCYNICNTSFRHYYFNFVPSVTLPVVLPVFSLSVVGVSSCCAISQRGKYKKHKQFFILQNTHIISSCHHLTTLPLYTTIPPYQNTAESSATKIYIEHGRYIKPKKFEFVAVWQLKGAAVVIISTQCSHVG